jgi:hypothetical protein
VFSSWWSFVHCLSEGHHIIAVHGSFKVGHGTGSAFQVLRSPWGGRLARQRLFVDEGGLRLAIRRIADGFYIECSARSDRNFSGGGAVPNAR